MKSLLLVVLILAVAFSYLPAYGQLGRPKYLFPSYEQIKQGHTQITIHMVSEGDNYIVQSVDSNVDKLTFNLVDPSKETTWIVNGRLLKGIKSLEDLLLQEKLKSIILSIDNSDEVKNRIIRIWGEKL